MEKPKTTLTITRFIFEMLAYSRSFPALLTGMILVMFIQTLYGISYPLIFKPVFDNLAVEGGFEVIKKWLILIAVIYLLFTGAKLFGEYWKAKLGNNVMSTIKQKLYNKLYSLPANYYYQDSSKKIQGYFSSDMQAIELAFMRGVFNTIQNFVEASLGIAILFYLDIYLATLFILILPFIVLLSRITTRPGQQASLEKKNQESELIALVDENVQHNFIARVYNIKKFLKKSFMSLLHKTGKNFINSYNYGALYGRLASLLLQFAGLVIIAIGSYQASQQTISIGTLIAFIMLMRFTTSAVQIMTAGATLIIQGCGGLSRIQSFLALKDQQKAPESKHEFNTFQHTIEFKNVYFKYDPKKYAINNLNMTINRGESIAFVGASGSGKSTILNLMLGLFELSKGNVYYDGHDLNTIDRKNLYQQSSIVLQTPALFNLSIKDNIRFGKQDATEDEIVAAAKIAAIHQDIMQMPHGYDTKVGYLGKNLSGGQRQRISIARAILKDPQLLFCDEMLSALDVNSEKAILDNLRSFRKNRTFILVTHRISTVIDLDKIYVFDQGSISESGTHQELLNNKGLYYQLWQKQSRVYIDEQTNRMEINSKKLTSIPLFSELDEESCNKLSKFFKQVSFQSQEDIIKQGDTAESFFIIARGIVDIYKQDSKGEEHFVASLSDGDYFGEMALLSAITRTATVRCRTDVETLCLTRSQFNLMVEMHPSIKTKLDAYAKDRAL